MTDAIDKAVREAVAQLRQASNCPHLTCDECNVTFEADLRPLADAVLEEAAKEFEGERADWDLDVPGRIRALKSEAQK